MDLLTIILLMLTGLFAGFLNVLSGGGSLIILPMLIFLGLPANVANGTSRIAIFLLCVVGVGKFHQKKVIDWKNGLYLSLVAIVGAIIGVSFATKIDEDLLKIIIGILLFVVLASMFINPKKWLKEYVEKQIVKKIKPLMFFIFFVIGFYGGFIQMGTGILMLVGLVLGANYDLIRANAIKLLIMGIYSPFVIYVFFINEQINWEYGLILALGSIPGAWIAANLATKKNIISIIRWIIITVVVALGIKLLFF